MFSTRYSCLACVEFQSLWTEPSCFCLATATGL